MGGVFQLSDGRALGYAEWGSRDGAPVFGFHGTSLSRLAHVGDEAPRATGVRLILVDRPGYGLSDHQPERTLLDWPADIAELADGLEIDRFAVFGMSGGGPHAAACGYALPARVSALGLVSAPAPVWDLPELRFSAPPHRRPLIELAERDPGLVARRLLEDCRAELERMAVDSRNGGKGGGPEADQAVMADPEVRARFEAATLETVERGPEGYARDLFLLYVAPWGFRPEEIEVPTQIWHGDADEAVSPRIAEFFAETITQSRLHMIPGAGHLILWSHAEEILASLKPA
jgi:pimeloyl-ACP methyl ester carboxylesterase